MRILLRLGLWFAGLIVIVALLLTWLLASESGARFIVGQLEARLPSGAVIGTVQGSFVDQLRLSSFSWRAESFELEAKDIAVSIRLAALLRVELHVETFSAGALDILQKPVPVHADETATPEVDFGFSSPVSVQIDTASVRDIQVRSLTGSRGIDAVELAAHLRQSDLRIEKLLVDSDWLKLTADAELLLREPYRARLNADWGLTTEDTQFSGVLALNGDASAYTIDHKLDLPLAIETTGEISLKPAVRASLLNRWSDLRTTYKDHVIALETGELSLEGNLQNFDVALRSSAKLDDRDFEQVELMVHGRDRNIELEALRVAGEGFGLRANGNVLLSQGSPYEAQLNIRLNASQLDFWHPDLKGAVFLNTAVDASFDETQLLTVKAAIASLTGNLRGHTVSGDGDVEFAGDSWVLRDFRLQAGNNQVTASGSLNSQGLQAQAIVAADDLRQLLPTIAGRLSADASLQGSLEEPVVQTTLALRNVRAFDSAVQSLDLNARLSAEQEIQLRLSASAAHVLDQDYDSVLVSLSGSAQAHRWEASVRHDAISVDATASGHYDSPRYALGLQTLDAVPQGLSGWTLAKPTEILIDAKASSTTGLCLNGSATQQVCIERMYWSPDGWDLQANAEQLPVRPLLKFLPLELEGAGSVSAVIALNAARSDPEGQFEVRSQNVEIWAPGISDEVKDKLSIVFNANSEIAADELVSTVGLSAGALGRADADIRLGSLSQKDGPIELGVELDFPELGFVNAVFPTIELHSGSIVGKATLSGQRSRPVGSGSLRLEDGSVSLMALGTDWTDVSLALSPTSPMQWNVDGGFMSGDGRLSLDGELDLDRDHDQWLGLTVTGEQAQLVQLPDMSLSASPDLNLIMGRSEASLKGFLRIPTGRIAIEELPEGAVQSSADTVVHLDDTSRANDTYPLHLALELVLGPQLQIDAFGLSSALQGDLKLDGDIANQLQGFGDLELRDGRFEAYGQELDISRGRLSFRGPLENPQLDFRARREVDIGEVGIEMRGTVNAPESSLYSSPAMPDSEILSWLLTGRGLNESSPENGERLSNAAVALGLSRAGAIVAELGGQLGLDRFEIADDGNGERLLAGKWVSEVLYLQYAYGIFDKLGSVLLRYRLSRRFTLESQSGAEQSLDLIYEVGRGN